MKEHVLRISMVQADIVWEDRAMNLAHYEALVRRLAGTTDLAVLPELFTTGSIRSPKLAEPTDGETVASLKKWAAACGMALTGSFMAAENGKCYNRSFFITPEGDTFYADKRHLFRMGGEDRRLEAGRKRLIVPYRAWNICVQVCYDLRFPVWSRNVGNAYDLLVYSANWPASRKSVWQTLLPARAMENLAYVCGVNRTGVDGTGLAYHGHSAIYSPLGEQAADAGQAEEVLCTCTLSKAALESVRAEFPVWKDADSFTLQGIEH
ncbi:MAG: nitrilase family protein [Tannerella sp.]|jgi:predicted amidohydrolase|nr:nitrilase family protein [Tannerella sp.]